MSTEPPAARDAGDAQWVEWVPVKVHYYETPIQAAPDQAALEDAGIPTVLQDGESITMDWALHRALGGTKIAVPADRLAEAERLLGGIDFEPTVNHPDWVVEDEREASRLQVFGLISMAVSLFAPFYWHQRARFRRKYPDPSPVAKARMMRATLGASVGMLMLLAFLVAVLTW